MTDIDTAALDAARQIMVLTRQGEHDSRMKAQIQCIVIEAIRQTDRPLTVEVFAECLETVWNAALGESHRRQEGAAFAAILAEATAAMARRAREIGDNEHG